MVGFKTACMLEHVLPQRYTNPDLLPSATILVSWDNTKWLGCIIWAVFQIKNWSYIQRPVTLEAVLPVWSITVEMHCPTLKPWNSFLCYIPFWTHCDYIRSALNPSTVNVSVC